MSGVPREIDETAWIDGWPFHRFFLRVFLPLVRSGVRVAADWGLPLLATTLRWA